MTLAEIETKRSNDGSLWLPISDSVNVETSRFPRIGSYWAAAQ